MARRLYHRGYNVEVASDDENAYRARLGGKSISGSLLAVKKCIDWWCDTNVLLDPEDFEEQESTSRATRVEEYKGIQLMSDSKDDDSDWYMIVRGNLMKGSLVALKHFLDKNEAMLQS